MSRLHFGLLGWPVAHSVSPAMQEAGFRALGIDAEYTLIPVRPEDVEARVEQLVLDGFRGWNITVPHKGAMRALVHDIEPAAAHADSVNTVVNDGGRLRGFSTDGYGLETATREAFDCRVAGGRFVFWGTGGAARATTIHFALQGAATLALVNRTRSKAEALATTLREIAPDCDVRVCEPTEEDAARPFIAAADVVYQCTSVGLHEGDPCAIPPALLASRPRVMDMIYRPTPLLAKARELGCEAVDGRGMLLHQGVRSFQLWTDRDPPVEAMREALLEALA